MFNNTLGGLSSEVVCMLDRACANITIRYNEDEWHSKNDGRFGQIIQDLYVEPGGVHGRCEADLKGCEIKTKNLASTSNDINMADFNNPWNADGVHMFHQTYNKIKDSLCFVDYVLSEPGVIIVKRITLYQDLPLKKFKSYIRIRNMNFNVNKNKLKLMYKKTKIIFDDLVA
jgi:hypothetical protein